jgi:cyanophycinase-like exopeptidase
MKGTVNGSNEAARRTKKKWNRAEVFWSEENPMRTTARFGLALLAAALLVAPLAGAPRAQYDYYLTGNGGDAVAPTRFGIGLMGGGTDVDALFTWMGEHAGGGDFVVIRASGADGYNQYVYELAHVDSVETLVLKNRAASFDPFVLQTIRNAEALFIAGGDQSDYVNNWKGTPVEAAINDLAARGVPIGGTSAGTAILSEFIYAAQRKSVTSSEALADPYSPNITLDSDFLSLRYMQGIITDQHLIERDRLGRTLTFMARIVADGWAAESKAIAIDRETAVLVEGDTGRASIVANASHPTPYAYFLRGGTPQVVVAKTPLTYTNIEVQRASPGSTFDVPAWSGKKIVAYTLNVVNGVISSTQQDGSIY